MKFEFGKAYCHVPSGKKVYLSQAYVGGAYSVHCNYSGTFAFIAHESDLRLWDYNDEKNKHVVQFPNMPAVTFNNFTQAVMFSVEHNAPLSTLICNP